MLDASTISAIAALVVALVALLVAFAQAILQYFITGQSIRLCDSVVFADMPGQGHRIWQASQFRFRVVYSIPQISLPNRFWPPNWSVSYKEGRHHLPNLSGYKNDDQYVRRRRVRSRTKQRDITLEELGNRSHIHRVADDSVSSLTEVVVRRHSETSSSDYIDPDESWLMKMKSYLYRVGFWLKWYLSGVWFWLKLSLPRVKLKLGWWRRSWKRSLKRAGNRLRWKIMWRRKGYHPHRLLGPRTGEAAWVSFCRVIHYSCHDCVRYDFVERDVDRCPADLPTVPMPLSLRDVVLMALSVGMQCTEASFTGRSLSMQGIAGVLATSQHPVLGPLLHFTPGDTGISHGLLRTGTFSIEWVARMWDECSVARTQLNHRDRRNVEKTAGVWIHRIRSTSASTSRAVASQPSKEDREKNEQKMERRKAVREEESVQPRTSTDIFTQVSLSQRKGFHDGRWELRVHEDRNPTNQPAATSVHIGISEALNLNQEPTIIPVVINPVDTAAEKHPTSATLNVPTAKKPYQATVEDDPSNHNSEVHLPISQAPGGPAEQNIAGPSNQADSANTREPLSPSSNHNEGEPGNPVTPADPVEKMRLEAVERQAERNAKAAKIADDENAVKMLEKEGRISPKMIRGQLLIGWKDSAADGPSDFSNTKEERDSPTPKKKALTVEEQEALDREEKRKREREERDRERLDRNTEQTRLLKYGAINWFWLSQMDIIPGFWATPWRRFRDLDYQTCSGAVTIILNALRGFTDNSSLRYVNMWSGLRGEAMDWVLDGHFTFPAYAHNSRGGVVCSGDYPAVKMVVFKEMVPAIELYGSYEYQVKRDRRVDTLTCQSDLLELMKLDAWLSICARTDEIRLGRNDLIKQTPAMVQLVMNEFDLDFVNLDQSDQEGGLQVNQALAANVMDFLLDEELSGAEQLYVLVATLRTVKVGRCILDGPDTRMLQEILREDIQVHMV